VWPRDSVPLCVSIFMPADFLLAPPRFVCLCVCVCVCICLKGLFIVCSYYDLCVCVCVCVCICFKRTVYRLQMVRYFNCNVNLAGELGGTYTGPF
jgi:hypothetical protein